MTTTQNAAAPTFTGILPTAGRPRLTSADLEAMLRPLAIDYAKYPLVVAGLRGYFAQQGNVGNRRNVYDDALCLYAPGIGLFEAFNGNTDPSKLQPGSGTGTGKGMATLNPGVWYAYRFDKHGGQTPYEAICQRAAPVTVTRDGEPPYADTGRFGINIHRGGNFTTSSEGCQTVPPAQWPEFYDKALDAGQKLFGPALRQRVIAYALIDDGAASAFVPPTEPEPGTMSEANRFLEKVIRPTLSAMGYGSAPAERLLLGTALAESGLRARQQLGNGPALGLFQMEPATHDDLWRNYLVSRKPLAAAVRSFIPAGAAGGGGTPPPASLLKDNDAYACAMARCLYLRVPEPLPKAVEIDKLASYWKTHYNTPGGGGTLEHFAQAWQAARVA
jgi:hypothetical protein